MKLKMKMVCPVRLKHLSYLETDKRTKIKYLRENTNLHEVPKALYYLVRQNLCHHITCVLDRTFVEHSKISVSRLCAYPDLR